jgi:sugar phosphate isomerase/epimerase
MRIGCQIGIWKEGDFEAKIAATGQTTAAGVETFADQLRPYHDEPDRFRSVLAGAGLVLTGAYFNSPDFIRAEAADAVVAQAAADCRFLRAVGGEFLLLNGGVAKGDDDRAFTDEEFAQLAKVFNRIGGAAAEMGVAVVTHPHRGCQVETPADLDRLAAAGLDWQRVGLCVHAAHQVLAGADPYAIYEKHAARVRYVHVGDCDQDGKGARLGEGVLDQPRLMQPLLEAGFDGWVIVECGQEGVAPADYVAHAADYLRRTWPDVNWQA